MTKNSKTILKSIAVLALIYVALAYIAAPLLWDVDTKGKVSVNEDSLTHTGSGIPGDPVNLALVGSKQQIMKSMVAAGWYPADPLTLKSCLEIADATVLKRPYDMAPVSSLYLFGKKEELAFEKPVGPDPRQRHHVRYWKKPEDKDGKEWWYGSATFDKRVGLSDTTGQITHHISSDVDDERNLVFRDLESILAIQSMEVIKGFQDPTSGKNGGGDPWHTDGNLYVGFLKQ